MNAEMHVLLMLTVLLLPVVVKVTVFFGGDQAKNSELKKLVWLPLDSIVTSRSIWMLGIQIHGRIGSRSI